MGQQVSITELKEQIEAAKRSLAEMSPVDIAVDPLFQPAAMPRADSLVHDGDQLIFQAFDQRLDRLENDIGQNRKHIHELITLLSDLDMAAKPANRNSATVKYLLRRNLYWFVIGLLVFSWGALTPSGHYWINYFLGLI